MKGLLLCLGLLVLAFPAAALFATPPTQAAKTSPAVPTVEAVASCEFASNSLITWSPVEIECPVCQTKNIFMVWGSYGSYIYQDPSKYQLVFWPFTASPAWHSCKKCHYTNFMGTFESVPKDKIPELRKMLEGVKLPAQKTLTKEESLVNPPYMGIPTSERLLVVEKVHRFLGQGDDDYWNHFYRVLGYHFEAEKLEKEAGEAREKSLAITERLLADKANDARRKEFLYIAGAMHHFLWDDGAALKNFEEAKELTYSSKDLEPEQNKNYNEYLNSVIKEYIEMLHARKGP